MKGMSTTLVIVVTAIVILVAALVLITIFGSGVKNVASIGEADSLCRTQAATTCKSIGQPPPTWNVPTMRVNDKNKPVQSCSEITKIPESEVCGSVGSGGQENNQPASNNNLPIVA